MMKLYDHYYELFPKVLQVGKEARVTIRPMFDHVAFKTDHEYRFELQGLEEYSEHSHLNYQIGHGFDTVNTADLSERDVKPEFQHGAAVLTILPQREQEYELLLVDSFNGSEKQTHFRLYAVSDDLVGLRPWKGDFHSHSCRSDGWESPLYVTSAYRQEGFDFHALTDHFRMPPSWEVIKGVGELETDYKVFSGEEVHPPDSGVHHINFGGSFSVNDCYRDKESYERELGEYMKKTEFPAYLSDTERRWYACSMWVFDKIRESGGISLFCHPYWNWGSQYNVSDNLMRAIFKSRRFDAFELLGGYRLDTVESNYLQVSRWVEECIEGNHMPVVGVSDSHGANRGFYFNWFYSVILAPTCEFADLAAAIRAERSVAVQQLPNESLQCYGRHRYVKYVYFIMREIMPLHDEECREEGRLMLKYFGGDKSAAEGIARCKDRVRNLYTKLFA